MERLEDIGPDLWIVEGGLVSFHGFAYPTRSVVARLGNGDLWIWSPVELTPELRAELGQLGPVLHLVSPNQLHQLFLTQWRAAYPGALLWGPRSTIKRRPDLAFAAPLEESPPESWGGAFELAWFRGSFALDEIVFFHKDSGVAIVADLIQAFEQPFVKEHWSWWRRPFATLGGISAQNPGAPGDWRLTFVDRSAARRARDRIFGWNCEKVVIAHGAWARRDGRDFLRRGFGWLGR